MEKDDLRTSLIKSVASSDLKNIAADLGEVTIDSFIDDEIVKDIPILGTIAKVYSAGATISKKIFERKILAFIIGLENISLKKRTDFVAKLSEDKKHEQKVGEHLVIILDRIDDLDKPAVLAKIFAAYIDKEIDYEMFLRLSSVIDKAFLPDLKKLSQFKKLTGYSLTAISLLTLGLVKIGIYGGGILGEEKIRIGIYDGRILGKEEESKEHPVKNYIITPLGEILLFIINKY